MKEIAHLLKNGKFIHLWISQIISQVVLNTLSFLILIYLFEVTHSTIATSFIWLAYALPAILFGPIASVTADLVDKRKALVFTLVVQAVTVIIYAFLYNRFIYLSYVIVFFYSLANQFYIPAEAATIPLIVKKKNLPFANSLFFTTVQLGLATGFLLAGIVYEFLGMRGSLAVSAILLIVASSSVSFLPRIASLEKFAPRDFGEGIARFFGEILEGYQLIKDTKRILLPFFLLIGLQVALSIIVVSLPVLAEDVVRVRASLSGIAIVIPGAVGALVATVVVPRLIAEGVSRRRLIVVSLFVLSVVLIILGAVVLRLPFWLGRTISVLSFFVAGATYVGSLIPTLTHLQITTPKDMLGRVFGSIWFITTAATVVPVIFSATITEVFGVSLMMTLLGILGLSGFFVAEVYAPGAFYARVRRFLNRRHYEI